MYPLVRQFYQNVRHIVSYYQKVVKSLSMIWKVPDRARLSKKWTFSFSYSKSWVRKNLPWTWWVYAKLMILSWHLSVFKKIKSTKVCFVIDQKAKYRQKGVFKSCCRATISANLILLSRYYSQKLGFEQAERLHNEESLCQQSTDIHEPKMSQNVL